MMRWPQRGIDWMDVGGRYCPPPEHRKLILIYSQTLKHNVLQQGLALQYLTHPKTMSSPYLTGSLSSGKTPSWGCELEPRGGEGWLLLQDGRSSRDGGGHSASELPSKTMPTGHNWGSLLGRQE